MNVAAGQYVPIVNKKEQFKFAFLWKRRSNDQLDGINVENRFIGAMLKREETLMHFSNCE